SSSPMREVDAMYEGTADPLFRCLWVAGRIPPLGPAFLFNGIVDLLFDPHLHWRCTESCEIRRTGTTSVASSRVDRISQHGTSSGRGAGKIGQGRSEEHTSELQSRQ